MANNQKNTIRLCAEMEKDIERMQLEIRTLQVELEEIKNDKRQ